MLPDPANMQAYNRYSYVLGNPLKYVDPTGNMPEILCIVADAPCGGGGGRGGGGFFGGAGSFGGAGGTEGGGTTGIFVEGVGLEPGSSLNTPFGTVVRTANGRLAAGRPDIPGFVRSQGATADEALNNILADGSFSVERSFQLLGRVFSEDEVAATRARFESGDGRVDGFEGSNDRAIAIATNARRDGRVFFNEAIAISQANRNPHFRVTVNADVLTVQLRPVGRSGRIFGSVTGADFATHGTVELVRNENGMLEILSNRFDFEPRNRGFVGETLTAIGGMIAGESAVPFFFDFDGTPNIIAAPTSAPRMGAGGRGGGR